MEDKEILRELAEAHNAQSAVNLELARVLLSLIQHLSVSADSHLFAAAEEFVKSAGRQAEATTKLIQRLNSESTVNSSGN